jgi:hypothetical protein
MKLRTLCRLLLAGAACMLGAVPYISAQPPETKCDWTAFERSAAEMRAARDKAMKVATKDLWSDVAPEVMAEIQTFKNGLNDAYDQFFLCEPQQMPEPIALEKALYQKLGLPEPKPPAQGKYLTERTTRSIFSRLIQTGLGRAKCTTLPNHTPRSMERSSGSSTGFHHLMPTVSGLS